MARTALLIVSSLFFASASLPAPAAEEVQSTLYPITIEQAQIAVGKALAEKGAGERIEASIPGQRGKTLYKAEAPAEIEVAGLQYDPALGRWSANLMFTANGAVLSALPASGRYQEMALVPVLSRPYKSGEVIQEADVEWMEYGKSRMRSDFLLDPAQMAGQTARRVISPHRPIRENELGAQALVKKNGVVKISYRAPNMEISVSGQALGEGAAGDVIQVRNLTSKQIVRAVVEDATTVSVAPFVQTSALTGEIHAN